MNNDCSHEVKDGILKESRFLFHFDDRDRRLATMAGIQFGSILLVLIGISSMLKPSHSYGSAGIQISLYPNLVTSGGLPPGYYRLEPGDLVQIQSSNYGISSYSSSDTSTWRFSGDNCGINIRCPCFNVPASFQCFGDYLRFIDTIFYTQRFCGDVAPQGAYRSVSGTFKITFRSDATRSTGKGYLCYVGCTAPGLADRMGDVTMQSQCFLPTTIPPGGGTTPVPGASSTTVVTPSISTTTSLTTIIPTTPFTQPTFPPPTARLGPGPGFIQFPQECQEYWRQIPVGETIRENKPPGAAARPRPPGIPPWCWI